MAEIEENLVPFLSNRDREEEELVSLNKVWIESKKLWAIVGPAIFLRLSSFSMNVITQAFAGHLGDLELASLSIAMTVVAAFNFGILIGMSSALETLCGQAFGAKKYHMLGVYLQRSWLVILVWAILLVPIYLFATPILLLLGQSPELALASGRVCIWFIPQHFAYAILFPMNRFLQTQLKNSVTAITSGIALVFHVLLSWLLVYKLGFGLGGAVLAVNISWWMLTLMQLVYIVCGGCPLTWRGLSVDAFLDLWEFAKLSAASGVMLCLEIWYYRVLVLLTGNLKDAKIAIDALSICMNINGWESMIPLGFLGGTGVRVSNELGAGNAKGAKFASIVSTITSLAIGLVFWCLILGFHHQISLLFTLSATVLAAVDKLFILLAFTILLNSIQPVLSGVAVGAGWQATVAYVNIGSYYLVGIPFGVLLGWFFGLGVLGIWAGMIGGTTIQTIILAFITIKCDWDEEAQNARRRVEKWNGVPK